MNGKSEEFIIALQVLCDRHGASLFFGDATCALWIGGEHCGRLQDAEGGDGSRFELSEDPALDPSEEARR